MSISFFNDNLLPELPFSIDQLTEALFHAFSDQQLPSKINIVLVDTEEIQLLNKEYRGKDEVTDVLSFDLDREIVEVYICLEYIKEAFENNFIEEILRTIIHGLLHTQGYDHKDKFEELDKHSEEMFKVQEEKLKQVMKYIT